jgi:hypothetical protein
MVFEGASELRQVITGSDVRYPVSSGYQYYRGTSSKTGRFIGKRGSSAGSSGACGSRLCGSPESGSGDEGDDDIDWES